MELSIGLCCAVTWETPDRMEVALGQIYLVRHGQTAWNKAKIFRGRRDVPLDEQGRLEAAAAAKALREVALGRIYTSPLSRARETAETIAAGQRTCEVVADDAFTDIDYGEWTEYSDLEARAEVSRAVPAVEGIASPREVPRRRVSRRCPASRRAAPDRTGPAACSESRRARLASRGAEAAALRGQRTGQFSLLGGAARHRRDLRARMRARALRLVVENDTRHLRDLAGHGSEDF